MKIDLSSLDQLRGLNATVMGLGLNGGGVACARFLAKHGAIVTVTDMKDEESLAASIDSLNGLPIRYVLGRHDVADFSNADLVVKNPAVLPDSPYLSVAKTIETDISLFLRFANSPIVAVTGSKGKSSVSSAIHYCLSKSGYSSFLGGNIAVSPLSFFEKLSTATPVVLELSSWQLADIKNLHLFIPHIAVITSIMPDHMNRYTSMVEYVNDKRIIYANQDDSCFTICNHDESWGQSFASETKGKILWYSDTEGNLPGAWLEKGSEPRGFYSSSDDSLKSEIILPSRLSIPGKHQRKNMLCAALACRAFGAHSDMISAAIASFPGVEHRLERFFEKDGVSWYNDSAATVPQAVAVALDAFPQRKILITGGTDKNLDFTSVKDAYRKASRIILLSGSGTDKLMQILENLGISYDGPFDNIDHAVALAADFALNGDIVLLSPGCTSFGMFKNEFDRGLKFKDSVLKLLDHSGSNVL